MNTLDMIIKRAENDGSSGNWMVPLGVGAGSILATLGARRGISAIAKKYKSVRQAMSDKATIQGILGGKGKGKMTDAIRKMVEENRALREILGGKDIIGKARKLVNAPKQTFSLKGLVKNRPELAMGGAALLGAGGAGLLGGRRNERPGLSVYKA